MDVIGHGLALYRVFAGAFINHQVETFLIAMCVVVVHQDAFGMDLPCLGFHSLQECSRLEVHGPFSLWFARNLPRTLTRVRLGTSLISGQNLQCCSSMDLLSCPTAYYLFYFLAGILNDQIVRVVPHRQIPWDLRLKTSLMLCWWITVIYWVLPALRYTKNQPDWSDTAMAVIDLTIEQCLMVIMISILINLISTVAEMRFGQYMERLILHLIQPRRQW